MFSSLENQMFRVVQKSEGQKVALKYSCAFCETTAADDYEYVQNLFHQTVREVRRERERIVASNSLDEETISVPIVSNIVNPSLSSSSSSNSSIHFLSSNIENEKLPTTTIPLAPPLPTNFVQKSNKSIKFDAQTSVQPTTKTNSSRQSTPPSNNKRTQSKTSSVFSKIFK